MKIIPASMHGRTGWQLDNGALSLFLMAGGGHIAGLSLKGKRTVNPFWVPTWKSLEPWQYRPRDAKKYAVKLLACIFGHNICLGAFGDPSPEEAKAGLGCHGEAPIVRWRCLKQKVGARRLVFSYGCDLPVARMRLERTVTMDQGSLIVRVRERVANLARCDVPFTMCQHVTFGAPFVEPGVTVFDMSAQHSHSFPGVFSDAQRLKSDQAFAWPDGPGVRGRVDLRAMGRHKNGDFFTNLMNAARRGTSSARRGTSSARRGTSPRPGHAWFSAVNPRQGLLVAYIWRQSDYPWLGVWEENRARKAAPWRGRELTRGMEFANTPFPIGLRKAVDLGKFQGQPTFRWLPALGSVASEYALLAAPVDETCRGVADISPAAAGFRVDLMS